MKTYREGITDGVKAVEALKSYNRITESLAKLTEPLNLF